MFTLSAHWSSDESHWLHRSEHFIQALQKGQFEQTLQAYHPGVTTMWLAGLRIPFFKNSTLYTPLNLARARWFIGVAILVVLAAIWFLLHRLFEFWQAASAGVFLSLSPFFIAQSRLVHNDALVSVFILLTALLFLLYCVSPKDRYYLILSGISFGLACVSKSSALILLLWFPICLWLFRSRDTAWRVLLYNTVITGILFLNWSLLTVFIVWPLFWNPLALLLSACILGATLFLHRAIQMGKHITRYIGFAMLVLIICTGYAFKTFWLVFEKVGWALTTAHNVEHFFLGKVVNDPGWLFYPFVLTIKSTPLMLPLVIVGCLLLWKHRKGSVETSLQFKTGVAIVIGVALFTICLSATSKKFPRYLLPVFLMLEILAAVGFVEGLKWSYIALRSRFGTEVTAKYKTTLAVLTCIGFFLIQVVPVFARHPYYGTYYNPCWKVNNITKIFTVGDGSGLDLAAKYLNTKPNTEQIHVEVSTLGAQFFYQYFDGTAYQLPPKHLKKESPRPPVDYEVVYIRDSQIQWVPQGGTRHGKLEHIITLNGIEYVWIYRIQEEKK